MAQQCVQHSKHLVAALTLPSRLCRVQLPRLHYTRCIPRKLAWWKAVAAALDAGAAAPLRLAGGPALDAAKAGAAIQ